MASPGDDYQSPIITQLLNSVGNAVASSVYIRDTIYDSSTNRTSITTEPNNHILTIANIGATDPTASLTIDYLTGELTANSLFTWSAFRDLFALASSTTVGNAEITITNTSIIIDGAYVKDSPANVMPIDFGVFKSITLTNCTFDILAIERAFSQPGPTSISIDSTNDFSKVYSFNHLFDGCNTLETINFSPTHSRTVGNSTTYLPFTIDYGFANLYSDPTASTITYTNSIGTTNQTFTYYSYRTINITLLDFTNCISAKELFNGTTFLSSISLSDDDFAKYLSNNTVDQSNNTVKQSFIGTKFSIGDYEWSAGIINSLDSSTNSVGFLFLTASGFVLHLSDVIARLTSAASGAAIAVNLSTDVSNLTIYHYESDSISFLTMFTTDSGSSRVEYQVSNIETNTSKYQQVYPIGFGNVISRITLSFSNCAIYSLMLKNRVTVRTPMASGSKIQTFTYNGVKVHCINVDNNNTPSTVYPIRSISFTDCYFGPLGLNQSFQSNFFLESVTFDNCDTSDVISLNSTFSRMPKISSLDLSSLDLSNVLTTRSMFYNGQPLIYYFDSNSTDITNHKITNADLCFKPSLATIRFPSAMSKFCSMRTAFYNCASLTSIYLPTSLPSLSGYGDPVNDSLSTDTSTKRQHWSNTRVVFSNLSETYSGADYDFDIAYDLTNSNKEWYEPSSLTHGDYYSGFFSTFYGCTSLTELVLPKMNSLRQLNQTFDGCTSLRSVVFGEMNNLDTIYQAFNNCSALERVVFPSCFNLRYIYRPFIGCSSLRSLTMLNCPNVERVHQFLSTSASTAVGVTTDNPAPVEEIELDGFNKLYRTNQSLPNQLIYSYTYTTTSTATSVNFGYSLFNSLENYSLRRLKLSGFNGSDFTSIAYAFSVNVSLTRSTEAERYGAIIFSQLEHLELSGFNSCIDARLLVNNAPSIKSVKMNGFSHLTTLSTAFANCSQLTSVDLQLSPHPNGASTTLDTVVMCERSTGLERLTFKGPRYIDINNSNRTNINFLNYCNNLKYLDISGVRVADASLSNLTISPIVRQTIDDQGVPVGWSLQPFHINSLIIPNLFASSTPSYNSDIPIGIERYKRAIITGIDVTNNRLTCKISVMNRYFIRRSSSDNPPVDWYNACSIDSSTDPVTVTISTGQITASQVQSSSSPSRNLGCFVMDNYTYSDRPDDKTTISASYATTITVQVTAATIGNYEVGAEYVSETSASARPTTYTDSKTSETTTITLTTTVEGVSTTTTNVASVNYLAYPCSFYQSRANVIWITSRTNIKENLEEYGFACNGGSATAPSFKYYSPIIATLNSAN